MLAAYTSFLFFSGAASLSWSALPKRSHIVFVLIDDLGYNDVGWRPLPHGPSTDLADAWPVTNRLAGEGVMLGSYYTMHLCSPTRSAFLTGRYPVRMGLQKGGGIEPGCEHGLPLSEVTLAEKLKAAGYRTIGVGKWHLGAYALEALPTSRGFDEWYGYWYGWSFYWNHTMGAGGPGQCTAGSCFLDLHDGPDLVRGMDGIHGTELYAARVEQRLRAHWAAGAQQPFFLYYSMQNVHSPLQVPARYADSPPCLGLNVTESVARQNFCALAVLADEAVGNLTALLAELYPSDEVLLIVSGDNGGSTPDGGNNMPLRGEKRGFWEGGVRNNALFWSNSERLIPLAARGSVYRGLVHVTDMHATILSAAGLNPDGLGGPALDGVSQLAALTGAAAPPRSEFLVNIDPNAGSGLEPGNQTEAAYRVGDWKYVLNAKASAYIPLNLSFVPNLTRVSGLYNIAADPEESSDLSGEHPELVAELLARIQSFAAQQVLPCDCGTFCDASRGQVMCIVNTTAYEVAAAAGGWMPWA